MANIQGLREKYKKIPTERFFAEIFEQDEYQAVLGLKTPVVLDVGALAGEFSAYIYDQAEVIYALEPLPSAYAELLENVTAFGLTNVRPLQLALAGETTKRFLTEEAQRGGHALVDDTFAFPKIQVEAISLPDFMREYKIDHIDLLKIDIEGGEHGIFTSKDFPAIASKLDRIIGEHLGDEVKEALERAGFVMQEQKPGNRNALFVRKELL